MQSDAHSSSIVHASRRTGFRLLFSRFERQAIANAPHTMFCLTAPCAESCARNSSRKNGC